MASVYNSRSFSPQPDRFNYGACHSWHAISIPVPDSVPGVFKSIPRTSGFTTASVSEAASHIVSMFFAWVRWLVLYSLFKRVGQLAVMKLMHVGLVWLLRNLESRPVSRERGSISDSRPRTSLEMDTLIHLYEQWPLWSYKDIASQMLLICPKSFAEPWSAEKCARCLDMLYAQSPERFGTGRPPPLFDHSRVNYITEAAETDSIITRLQPTLCKECAALNLGKTHVGAMIDFDDFWAGPNTEGHPADQSLCSLKRSSVCCHCCEFMYNAASHTMRSLRSERLLQPEADDLQTRLGFTRCNGEQCLEIRTATSRQTLALLRMAHLNDWLPFRYSPGRSGSPNSDYTIAQVVPEVPDLDYIAGRIRCWQTECELHHPSCGKSNDTDVPLPPRVLLIIERGSQLLVQLRDSAGQRDHYVALSYVWGDPEQFSLTSESEQSLRAGVKPTVFAKTIREAIELTHALGFHYIWIDALCIRQDSRSDWDAQSTLMGQIYGNSGLTILAARSPGVQNGFLRPTTPCAVYCGAAKFKGTLKPVFLTHSKVGPRLPPDPLDLRAWTLQEECVSRRKVKFISRQMEWHCQSQKFEEQESERSYHHSRPQSTLPNFRVNAKYQWKEIVETYSARQLTRQSDRLPALSGIAHLCAAQTQYEYLAGLWSGPDLIELLLWFPTTDSSECPRTTVLQSPYIAPTWSWLAVDTPVTFKNWLGPERSHKHIAMDLNCSVTPKTMDPFGEITDGHLDLSGPAIRTTIAAIMNVNEHRPSASWIDNSVYLQRVFPEHIMEPMHFSWAWPRFRLDKSNYDRDLQVHCVILGYEWWDQDDYGMYGIIVTPISFPKRTFRRIGMFYLLPKFRFSDQGLDMRDVIEKRSAENKKAIEHYWVESCEHDRALWSPDSGKGLEEKEHFTLTSVFQEELRKRAQTIREDVEFYNFRIL